MSRKKSSFRPKHVQAKKAKIRLYKFGGLGAVGVLLLTGAVLGVRSDFFNVQNVTIAGNDLVKVEAVREIVDDSLKEKYLWLIPKSNFLLFPRSRVEETLMDEYPTLASANVYFSGLNNIIVGVNEYRPAYLWCVSKEREKCYFMDKRGYIFSEAADFSQGVLFTYYGLIDPGEPVGKIYMNPEKFAAINKFVESLKLLKLTPVGLSARGQADFEIYLISGGKILFSDREDFLLTFSNLETIVAKQSRLNKNFLNDFEYIDARFANKAFVKLR